MDDGGRGNGDASSETILDVIEDDSTAVPKIISPFELALLTAEQSPAKQKSTMSRFKRLVSLPKRFSSTGRSIRTSMSAKVHALKGFKFITAAQKTSGWRKVEEEFDKLTAASGDGHLHCSNFGKCIGMEKSPAFAAALFSALAKRQNITADSINREELRDFWDQISDESFDIRLQTYLAMVDKDGDGKISEEELRQMILLSASTNKLKNIQSQAKEHAALIMEHLDPLNAGYIMTESLEAMLLDAETQSAKENDDTEKFSQTNNGVFSWHRRTQFFLMDNWQREWVMILWLAVIFALFTYKFIQFKNKAVFQVMGYCVSLAKGSGETLKFNMAIVLLPICRNTITRLRTKMKLGVAVPFDDNLNFHKVVAIAIAVGVSLHGVTHLACDFPRLLHATTEEYEPLKKYFGEVQPDSYWWFVKGFAGWTGIAMVVLMVGAYTLATPWFRRNKIKIPKPLNRLAGFNAFWYSHHLFVIVYGLLIVHGIKIYLTKTWYQKTTWMYLAVPVILYGCERLIRAFRSSIKTVKITKVVKFEGSRTKVLSLRMSKPTGFNYKSGQYMFVKCSAVSPFEWHPFSITSAPGDDYLGVHIKADGDWTGRLIAKFSEASHPLPTGKSGLMKTDYRCPKISIDGPYGAPAQDYSNYDVVLLVGLGIGGTPMVSIIKDIIHNNIKGRRSTLNPKGTLENKKGFRTQKAYFYWVTPDQDCSQWFKEVMNDVAEMDEMHLIELNNFCTSVYKEDDARSALIMMLQSLQYDKKGVDVVSGTRVRSHFSRPDWRKVYNSIVLHHPKTRVGVFYCGAPTLTKELRNLARHFSQTTSTKFEFHKENF